MSIADTEDFPSDYEDSDATDQQIADALHRGHQDGSIDPQLSVEWISNSVWAMLYAVYYIPVQTSGALNSFEARQQALRTLLKAAATDPANI